VKVGRPRGQPPTPAIRPKIRLGRDGFRTSEGAGLRLRANVGRHVPSTGQLFAFAVVSLVFVAIPGPSVLFAISRALTLGRRPALLTVVGNAAGVYLHVVAVALGIGAVGERSLTVFTILKLAGSAYLIYLGVQAIRHHRAVAASGRLSLAPRATGSADPLGGSPRSVAPAGS